MLMHGENIVDLMGGEIDRIEMKLRVSFERFRINFANLMLSVHRKSSHKCGTATWRFCNRAMA